MANEWTLDTPFSIHRRADVKDLHQDWWLATVARAKALTKVMTKVGHAKYYY